MIRLYRSENSVLLGVCKGIADKLNVDPKIVQAAMLVLTIFTGMRGFTLYLILACSIPTESFVKYNKVVVNKKWHRAANNDRAFSFGVCRGLAEKFEIDVEAIRIAFLSLAVLAPTPVAIALAVIYLIAGFTLPLE